MKYILFCSHNPNFNTLSLLIPYDLFISSEQRAKDLKTLNEYSRKNVQFGQYNVDQLLVEFIKWKGNVGDYIKSPVSEIIKDLCWYAEYGDENLVKPYDKVWYKHLIAGVASDDSHHIRNYCKFRDVKVYKNEPIEIVQGFLVLAENS